MSPEVVTTFSMLFPSPNRNWPDFLRFSVSPAMTRPLMVTRSAVMPSFFRGTTRTPPELLLIHMVSSAAITGAQHSFDDAKQAYFRRIDQMNLRNPRMIGFGISNRQTLEAAQQNAAGAIIGSKFVTLLNESKDADEALDKLFEALA